MANDKLNNENTESDNISQDNVRNNDWLLYIWLTALGLLWVFFSQKAGILGDKWENNHRKSNTTEQVIKGDTIGENIISWDTQSIQQPTQVSDMPLDKRDTTYFWPQAVTIWPSTEDISSTISDTLQWDRSSK